MTPHGCDRLEAEFVIRDPNEYRRKATEDAFAEALLDSFLKCDPVELDDRYGAVMLRARLQAGKEIAEGSAGRSPYKYCGTLKAILSEQYNIRWKTPAEMNPEVEIDLPV